MPAFRKTERRALMAERRPSASYIPAVIPPLSGLEKPNAHSLALEQCDILILGTGLVESILAAALAWQGVAVLHIDRNPHYGDTAPTLTIEQLKRWCVEANQGQVAHVSDAQIYVPGGERTNAFSSTDYGVDLSPKVMFAQLDLLALLVRLKVYRYVEFQSVSNFHMFENDHFLLKLTGASQEQIFTDQQLLVATKRSLMRFLKFVLQDNAAPHKAALLAAHAATPIGDFLRRQFHLAPPQADELPPAHAHARGRFLVSLDVYGKFPVMVLRYGGPGELAQGFCRSAAVAGATYKLATRLVDYDPQAKVARFDDGSRVRINEKIVVLPNQVPRFLQSGYAEAAARLPPFSVTRLVAIVRNACAEWMAASESSAVVVFPPHSLPTHNQHAVQALIQNGGAGVCPAGEAIWYLHTPEPHAAKAKADLESAFAKMENALLRESATNLDDVLDDKDFVLSQQGTPILVNSFKLGESLLSFVPTQALDIVCKIGFVQKTYINPDLSNVLAPEATLQLNISNLGVRDSADIMFLNMPSAEISYDGVVGEVKLLYQRITGSCDDFFDVDFEDDEDDDAADLPRLAAAAHAALDNDLAIDDDYDSAPHEPFGADEMEL
ncbi:hypothetical protein METBIDRAFT_78811 [Metschnikowia bicuspidata var. bicuspidata NRRL YB-4993]|uniref:Rab proteins geranylgeranyltransferase n=1 Tax=Metschnikowia bicuspidata var. bicuspidata NRRL YB-4993 TaxID=869754 RepID=A0A1A0H961_9ASCO|nr:hypothetical protein METBIDRAFT_78811 [Metschnikowia bicuspidata var. bicuspidata NRRL YB-4993]OBA20422.1 hypothetical protein METBIDRAFT_78811 [Metschnikowia bicuspidata var. bicuspidata NRRL YB-4993]